MSETQERDERVTFKMRFTLIWAIESKTLPYLYTGILIFWHLVGKRLQTSKVIWARCAPVHSNYITPS